jgi:hypothetical protein
MPSEKEFAQWLNRPENFNQIKKMAAAIQKKLAAANLRLPGTNHDSDPWTAHEVICQELCLFLIETQNSRQMLLHDPSAAAAAIIRNFLNQARNMIRSKRHTQDVYKDNWRSFRRHVLAVLRDADEFVKFPSHRDMAFGLSDTARPVFIPPEKIADIPFPPDVPADFERMNHKKQILRLADYFWDHCTRIADTGPVRINLNDFILWIGMYVPLQLTPEIPMENESPVLALSVSPSCHEKETYLKTWAHNFFNRLNFRQKQIFYFYNCKGYTGKQVAELMGKKSHLSYQHKLIQENLKQFLCPLEWLSPSPKIGHEPADPDAFLFFMEELCATLGRNLEKTF